MRTLLSTALLLSAATLAAAQTSPATRPAAQKPTAAKMAPKPPAIEAPKPVPGYEPILLPANIAPTQTTAPTTPPQVNGQPRTTVGHPNTLWDKEDIAHYQELLKTSKSMQDAFAKLKIAMDAKIAQPINVPGTQKADDGSWMYPGDMPTYKDVKLNAIHKENAAVISDLGTLYALTGDTRYADYAKKILLAYADNYTKWGHPKFKGEPWTTRAYRSAFDGRVSGQFLEDGFWLIQVARGYDLVYNLPSWTDDERKQIREDLLEAVAAEFTDPIIADHPYTDETHNRSVICNAGVLMAGYASDSEKLINIGLYGRSASKEKPSGGVMGVHFSDKCILPDGMWNEGAMGYQNMACVALIDDAETLWHHNIDMYRYNNGILKRLFDAEILFTYPDLTFPSTHDSGRFSIIPTENWNDDGPRAYEYAYLRYQDPRYLVPVTPIHISLRQSVHFGPPSILFDVNLEQKAPITITDSTNFFDTGYGILRLPNNNNPIFLLLQYGLSRSHGHPDKLELDFYANGDVIIPDPGVIFPYGAKLDYNWYWTTPAHATLTVDEKPQVYAGNRYKFPRNFPDPGAKQLVFAPGQTVALQRAYSDTTYPGVAQDRSVFLTDNYLVDIFGAFSAEQHKYDLAWHLRGDMTTDLPLKPLTTELTADGYNGLGNPKSAPAKDAYEITVTKKDKPLHLLAAATTGDTEVLTGDGHYRYDDKEKVPAIYQRRSTDKTIFVNALDFSAGKTPYLKSITQEGSLDAGYALAKIETTKGADYAFTAFKPAPEKGTYKAGPLETDAQQALITTDGTTITSMTLAGGKTLSFNGATLTRSEPGLAILEKLPTGAYSLSNPSPTPATLTITLPNKPARTIDLKPNTKTELTP